MKLTWKHILLACTLFLVSAWWFYLISPTWWLLGVGLLLITTIWPPNLEIRLLCLTLLILTISRPLVNPYVRFELVLPNNFVGDFYLIEHPSGDGHLQLSGLW